MTRIERWYWLIVFCVISLGVHAALAYGSRSFDTTPRLRPPTEIEVALEAPPEPAPRPAAKPKPPPGLNNRQIAKLIAAKPAVTRRAPAIVAPNAITGPLRAQKSAAPTAEQRPAAPELQPGGLDKLKAETPALAGLPTGVKDAGEPKLLRIARADPLPKPSGGGGSPAPGIIPGGHGGARGPEAPPEDILFNGGGAGGLNLPREAPRIGGGGGNPVLSVENPLAKDAIPDDRPGLGPGRGGADGAGTGGGVGYGRGKGIGTRLDGTQALATLHAKAGAGIGAGVGSGIGSRPPGGGHGTGAELPGTGGTGIGYGRGSGIGIGNGSGEGVGDGAGVRPGKHRGVPLGDIAGLLRGDPHGGGGAGGGPGGAGRGALFGVGRGGGGSGALRVCYCLDVSGSMLDGHPNKISVAKRELTRVLHELKPGDKFDIITFYENVTVLSDDLVVAVPFNVSSATDYVHDLRLGDGTNMQGALDAALAVPGVTDIYILSDGEPNVGIRDPAMLRQHIKDRNTRHVRINALAIGLGEHFRGMALLKGFADDNDGEFRYINVYHLPTDSAR